GLCRVAAGVGHAAVSGGCARGDGQPAGMDHLHPHAGPGGDSGGIGREVGCMSENQSVGYPASDKTSDPSTSRKLAEWITMILSAMIVLAVAGYLVYGITQPDEPFVA